MISRRQVGDHALGRLAELACTVTGFTADAILIDRLRAASQELLAACADEAELLGRAARRDPEVLEALARAVSVGETWFFRQPEHFRYLRDHLLPGLLLDGRRALRAWSAGCASGEEAWSIAATLADSAPGVAVDVLGTDLIPGNLAAAAAGRYRAWSRREAGPILHPIFAPGDTFITIAPALRPLVRFERHNLLDAPPVGRFEVVFCRQVLIYFRPEAAARAVANLASAVAPGGALIFGPLDLGEAPAGFWRVDPPELQIFRRGPDGGAGA